MSREAPRAASQALAELTQALFPDLNDLTAVVADVGPGSFIGSRVGVTFAKALAFAKSVPAGAVTSFDLIAPTKTVVLPSRKGVWIVRPAGQPFELVEGDPWQDGEPIGYGGPGEATFPDASRWAPHMTIMGSAFELMPLYGSAPSISQPKVPHLPGAIR